MAGTTGTIDTGNAIVDVTTGGVHVRAYAPAASSYTSALTANASSGALQYLAMATGAKQIRLTNSDVTDGDILLVAFGVDDSDAQTNFAAGQIAVMPKESLETGIPTSAQDGGSMAYRSASANTIVFYVSQSA